MQDIARLKHRMPHPRNELRCTLFQKAAKYHGVSVGVAIIQRGYIRMRIDPDDSNVLVFPVQVIEEGKRHHTVAADGHDSVGVFCRKLPLRILNPRQDFVLGIDANCLPFLMSKFGTRFTMSSGTPGQSDHVVAPFERVTSITVPFSELVSTSTVPP